MNHTELKTMVDDCANKINSIQSGLIDMSKITDIKFNSRIIRALGRCRRINKKTYILEFSSTYFNSEHITVEEKLHTVYHELIHTIDGCFNHGDNFKRVGRMIERSTGIKGVGERVNTSSSKEYKQATYKYKISCNGCNTVSFGNRSMGKTINGYSKNYFCKKCGEFLLTETKIN
jgi:predicted SprT family Zn-dependent metalloprotease